MPTKRGATMEISKASEHDDVGAGSERPFAEALAAIRKSWPFWIGAAPQRFGRETPSNKTSRHALEATGALLALAALTVFLASPPHAGTVVAVLLIAGLLLTWLQS